MVQKFVWVSISFVIALAISGCGIYSFTGASISPDIKTVSVAYITNNAPLIMPTLSQTLTDGLIDKLANQTTLQVTKEGADIQFEGEILDYVTTPMAITNDEASLNRLTVTVNMRYINTKEEKLSFEQKFTRYEDYSSDKSLSEVEEELLQSITQEIIDDIFNKALVNW